MLPTLIFIAVTAVLVYHRVPVDDAFITFRYAENLAAGEGAVFNVGERVEGYSSSSWLLILAAASFLGPHLPEVAVVLGTLCGVGTLVLLASSRAAAGGPLAALLTALFLPFCYHAANGLETGLFALLVTALATLELQTPRARSALLVVAGLLPLTRPEGLLLLLLWWGSWSAWVHDRSTRWRHLAAAVGVGAWLAQLAWRLAYFGEWIPNAARAKLLPVSIAWPHGLRDLGGFTMAASGWGILFSAAILATWQAARRRTTPGSTHVLAQACFLVASAATLSVSGGDSFPLWRFLLPLAPIFFLLAACGFSGLGTTRPPRLSPRRWLLVALACIGLWQRGDAWIAAIAKEQSWVGHWQQIGERLREVFPRETTIALSQIGAIPYYSLLRTIDMLGLIDPHVARQRPDLRYWYPGHQKHDGPYIISRKPDLILLANGPAVTRPGSFPWRELQPYERDLARTERFRTEYTLWHLPMHDGTLVQLFIRRDAPRPAGWMQKLTSE